MKTLKSFIESNNNMTRHETSCIYGCDFVESYGTTINNAGCTVNTKDTWKDSNGDGIRNCDEPLMTQTEVICPPCNV